jgi:hypothetical protein
MKKLSLDDFKKKANKLKERDVLATIKGGNAVATDCHNYATMSDKICGNIIEILGGH